MLPSGNLLVADTGNKRLIEFTPGGEYVRQVGGGGIILGYFDEPVDVTVHPPTGLILVSDAWNRRIQVLTADLQPLTEWPMPTWESDQIWDKPYLAAGADGMIYASDPQYAQVLIISADGVVRASFGRIWQRTQPIRQADRHRNRPAHRRDSHRRRRKQPHSGLWQ